jgi:hypothetical protein
MRVWLLLSVILFGSGCVSIHAGLSTTTTNVPPTVTLEKIDIPQINLNYSVEYTSEGKVMNLTTYEYYNSSRLKEKIVYEEIKHTGNEPLLYPPYIRYVYYDELFYSNGEGRLKEKFIQDGDSPHAGRGIEYLSYFDGTDMVKEYRREGRIITEVFGLNESKDIIKYTRTGGSSPIETNNYTQIQLMIQNKEIMHNTGLDEEFIKS